MSAASPSFRHVPHPLWAAGVDVVTQFRHDPAAAIVVSTDALELLLEESDLDDSIRAAHITPLDGIRAFYSFGATQAAVGWAAGTSSVGAARRIEGVYCASERRDASAMSVDERTRFNLVPAPCEVHHLIVVDRLEDTPACSLHAVDLVIQNPDEGLHQFVNRHVRAHPAVVRAIGGERLDGLLRHIAKLWLYLTGDPDLQRIDPTPTPRGFTGPAVPAPMSTLLVGPEKLEPLLGPKALHDDTVAVWRRGRLIVSDINPDGSFVLRWLHPALIRRDPSIPY